jgi:hypothetical protein
MPETQCQHERDPLAAVSTGNPPTWRCLKCGGRIPGETIVAPLMPEKLPGFIYSSEPVDELRKYFIDDGPAREAKQNELLDQILVAIWNARGAADANAVDDRLATLTGWVTSEPYRQHLREAIAALDRP